MSKQSRRAFVLYGLLGSQSLLAGCGGGDSEPQAEKAALGTAPPAPAPVQGPALAPTSAPTPTPAAPPTSAPPPPPTPAPAPAPVTTWTVTQSLSFAAGAAQSIDLKTTLPPGVPGGGVFAMFGSGAALPYGVTLTSDGLLNMSPAAAIGATAGLVFSYDYA